MAMGTGVSFWVVPSIAAIQTQLAIELGDPNASAWYTSIWTIMCTIAFLICGVNSDLFGRRWFLIGANVLMFIGYLVGATAKNNTQMYAAMGLLGFGGGNAQLAAFAIGELLPNKWRAVGVVIAGMGDFTAIVVGPIVGRWIGWNGLANGSKL